MGQTEIDAQQSPSVSPYHVNESRPPRVHAPSLSINVSPLSSPPQNPVPPVQITQDQNLPRNLFNVGTVTLSTPLTSPTQSTSPKIQDAKTTGSRSSPPQELMVQPLYSQPLETGLATAIGKRGLKRALSDDEYEPEANENAKSRRLPTYSDEDELSDNEPELLSEDEKEDLVLTDGLLEDHSYVPPDPHRSQ